MSRSGLMVKLGWYNLKSRWHAETAYFGSNWSNMFSTTAYTATTLLGLDFLFRKIPDVAGMNRNQLVFMFIVGQLSFYTAMIFTIPSITRLVDDIRTGRLDMLLTKPMPILWNSLTANASLLALVRDVIPAAIPYFFIAKFSNLGFQVVPVLCGIAIFALGVFIDVLVFHIFALTTVWHHADDVLIRMYAYVSRTSSFVPFDTLPIWFKGATFIAFPSFIAALLSVSVMLGRLPAGVWLGIVSAAAVGTLVIYGIVQSIAIKAYGSASS